jgi:hypothetical protein
MKRKAILIFFLCFSLIGTSFSGDIKDKKELAFPLQVTAPPADGTEEFLIALAANDSELTINVRSGGCTEKEDFRIFCVYDEASAGKTRHYVLTIYRIKKDECKAIVRNGLEIKYDLKRDLDLPDIFTYTLTNGIGASPY